MKVSLYLAIFILISTCQSSDSSGGNFDSPSHGEMPFMMDLSEPRTIEYDLISTTKSSFDVGDDYPSDILENIMTADLSFIIKENEKVDLNLSYEIESSLGADFPDDMGNSGRNVVVQNALSGNETVESSGTIPFSMMFPALKEEMKIGETYIQERRIPFNMYGSSLEIRGDIIFELLSIKEEDGVKIAMLKSEFDVSNIDVPETLELDFQFLNEGTAAYEFDLDGKYFSKVELNGEMSYSAQAKDGKDIMGVTNKMSSKSTYTFEIALKND